MKADELRDLNDEDLKAKVAELKESIFRMRFKLSLGNTDVVKSLQVSRKDLARVLTLINEREAAAKK
jgi:large subunit ribosomal protein L29